MSNVSLVDGHIDEPRLTDEEIMKALEWHLNDDEKDCTGCSYKERKLIGNCVEYLLKDSLDLINRQKAEIENLDRANLQLMAIMEMAQSEARKEFAERLKKKATYYRCRDGIKYAVSISDIDNLLKEMEGEL